MSQIKTAIQIAACRLLGAYRVLCLMQPGRALRGLKRAKQYLKEHDGERSSASIILCDVPNHGNLGDQAIALAEEAYLVGIGITSFAEVDQIGGIEDLVYYRHILPAETTVILHGGGNMGSLYKSFEFLRAADIGAFPHGRILSMPQTADYRNAEGRMLSRYMEHVYASAKQVMLLARDKPSFEAMKRLFPTARIELTPDIVMTYETPYAQSPIANRHGALVAFRSDGEVASHPSYKDVADCCNALDISKVEKTDTALGTGGLLNIPAEKREPMVYAKLEEFSHARIVVTDRLHGMVMSAITGTPCVAFNNSNGKVKALYETWMRSCPYIRFSDGSDWRECMESVLSVQDNTYDFSAFRDRFGAVADYLGLRN
ncbi:polysaccharide pyruvyl transferase family protein [Bifidobacterium saguinibicoloris]|uniref:polysaccharide pyruvyl transferase family protein n=1 Tax=Bifidobacterium saguinibicoloris TaxID=2834433 RepID=UPI001C55A0E4|nr:polysaccharide pyruvyl transferase family protein [Bifidobacterium saguinibicoloris]MBW3081190.1 polysaccharide pyruvyl transferase family protein [Bifidobacterium saguinibicoloris]